MNTSSRTLKKGFCVVGLMIAAILACTSVYAGDDGTSFSFSGKDLNLRGNLSKPPDTASGAAKFIIPLSPSLSLDLGLSSVDRGQSPTGEKEPGTPPIPVHKAPGSDLRYSRLGVGLSFEF